MTLRGGKWIVFGLFCAIFAVIVANRSWHRWKEKSFRPRTEAECTSVDVRDGMSPRLQAFFSTPRDQGKLHGQIGDCFAIGTADILSYLSGRPVSALHILFKNDQKMGFWGRAWRWAASLLERNPPVIPDGGMLRDTLQGALARDSEQLCPERLVPSSHPDMDMKASLRSLKEALVRAQLHKSFRKQLKDSRIAEIFPSLDPGLFARAVRKYSRKVDLVGMLGELTDLSCQGNEIAPQADPDDVITYRNYPGTSHPILDEIDSQLDHRPRPNLVAFLYDTGYTRADRRPSRWGRIRASHVSTILGRQYDQDRHQCEYLVRDSLFGPDCSHYNAKNVKCVPGQGTYWVSDRILWKMTESISFIRPKFTNDPDGWPSVAPRTMAGM